MSTNLFIPKMGQDHELGGEESELQKQDEVSDFIKKIAGYAVVLMFGLMPLFFISGLWATLGFSKSLFAIAMSVVVIILVSLLALRLPRARTVLPLSLIIFWGLVFVALVSAVLSGDEQDALRGVFMETQTVAFIGVLGLAMTVPLILQGSKVMGIKALGLFGVSATLLLVYNLVRLLSGEAILSLGSFNAVTISPVGGFNDLALFAGLVIVIGLITLHQLPLKSVMQSILFLLILASLGILAVVNFFNVWIVVGFFALLMFVYLISRDKFFSAAERPMPLKNFRILITATALTCIVSVAFILAGDYLGTKINATTNVNYVEVQPTFGATVDIAKSVYTENWLLGVGPNRFADAWRMHKYQSINETIFWDTDFNSGSGFVPTLFVNLGILGGLLLVAFHLYFLRLGYRVLLKGKPTDTFWYYFGAVSFTAACFVWGMSYIYLPGAGILLIGAMFTGFTFVSAGALLPHTVRRLPLASNRQRGFFLMSLIIIIIVSSIGVLYSVSKQYVAQSSFNQAQSGAETGEELEAAAKRSFDLYRDDRFLVAVSQVQLANLNALIASADPSQEQQLEFVEATEKGISFAENAIKADYTDPENHSTLANIFINLAVAGVDGARAKAEAELELAENFNPLNPRYHLTSAQLSTQVGDVENARASIARALELKNNYTEALYLSAQLDINEGNATSAIATTRSIVMLEPNNPTRYFQLGVLLAANNENLAAINAFETAVALQPVYANARYLLAIELIKNDQPQAALGHLRIVEETNPNNLDLKTLISQVESGEFEALLGDGLDIPLDEATPQTGIGDTVTTDGEVDTDLVMPVNTISAPETEETVVEMEVVPEESETSTETEEAVTE